MSRILGVFTLLIVWSPGPVHAAPILNLLTNGSFEDGPAMGGQQDVDVLAGSTAISGWTVIGQSIDYLGSPWDVSDGAHAIDLDGRNAVSSGIQQAFPTTIGQIYAVTFDLSGNPQGSDPLKNLLVSVGAISHTYTFDTSGQGTTSLEWEPVRFLFTASDSFSTLTFSSLTTTPSSYGPLIDNIAVAPVPEPSTLVLFGSGLAAGTWWRRRRNA
jgi:choice-of-anchor C domain-containing protein